MSISFSIMNDRYSSNSTHTKAITASFAQSALGVVILFAFLLNTGGCSQGQAGPFESIIGPLLPPSPSQLARDMWNRHDADARRNAVALLSSAYFGGDDVYVDAYRELTTDEDDTVRAAAVRALGMHGKKADALILIKRLNDKSEFVRWEAAKGLQKIHHEKAIAPLTKHVTEESEDNADVRIASVVALGQYPKGFVFDALLNALHDNDFAVVHSAHYSLVTLTGQDKKLDSGDWDKWAKKNTGHLFDKQQQYTWKPFEKPETFFERVLFWKTSNPAQPQKPVGIEDAKGKSARTPS